MCLARVVLLVLILASSALSAAEGQPLPAVAVAMPVPGPIVERLQLTGTLNAERDARLSPRVDGMVARLHVDAGDFVQAGDRLLELDDALARLALERSRADSAWARAQAEEAARLLAEGQRLVGQQHIPATEVATREVARALAEAELAARLAAEQEQAELLERHVLTAPFAGVIVRRLTEAGEWVSRGTPVLELVALDRVRLDVHAPQERYTGIAEDAEVTVQSDILPDLVFPARIVARVPVVGNTGGRSFLVRILIDAPRQRLLPGTSATATISLKDSVVSRDLVRVPRDALLRHPDGGFSLFVLEGDAAPVARRYPVHIGRQGEGMVEILEPLPADRPVVVRGNEMLLDGQRVRVISD